MQVDYIAAHHSTLIPCELNARDKIHLHYTDHCTCCKDIRAAVTLYYVMLTGTVHSEQHVKQ